MASRVVRARLDEQSEQGLATLMREGRNESEAVRAALVEAGQRRLRRSALDEEVRRLAEDPADTAERRGHGRYGRRVARLARVTRGEVYRVRLPTGRGREQRGHRYAVIVQADALLGLSTAVVAPTSRSAAAATFRPEVQVAGESTRVLVEQLRAIDLQRLDEHMGRLAPDEQRAVDEALELVLGL